MLETTQKFKDNLFGDIRQFDSRVTIKMTALAEKAAKKEKLTANYVGKIENSILENPHFMRYARTTGGLTLPTATWNIPVQSYYNSVMTLDNSSFRYYQSTAGYACQKLFTFDIIRMLERKYGVYIWEGRDSIAEKIERAKEIIGYFKCSWSGYARGNDAYKSYLSYWRTDTNAYDTTVTTHTNSVITTISRSSVVNVPKMIDANGHVHFIVYTDKSTSTMSSDIYTDYVEFEMEINFTDTRQYDDDTVIRINVLEEMSILNESLPSNQLSLTLDNSTGEFDFLTYSSMQKIIASKPRISVELGLVYDDGTKEWIPTGVFFLTDFKNEITNKIITITGNDYFSLLSEVSFTPTTTTNLKSLAIEVLNAAGIPARDQVIDDLLNTIYVNPFPDRIDCRSALQHIAIASRTAVFQDRLGNIVIKTFENIDEVSNYITYATSQNALWGYAGTATYALNNTAGGMRYVEFDHMYDAPDVSLEKSIYQLVIKVYPGGDAEPIENVYTNLAIEGLSGESFTIDNPLVNSNTLADKIAEWYMREMNYNALYRVHWRQNPSLECSDLVLIEDSFGAEKQSRIIRQEFNYEGYLEGTTESRGGV